MSNSTSDAQRKFVYNFCVWPDESWGTPSDMGQHSPIPAAVFDLFRMTNHSISVEMSSLEFVRFRHDVGSFGLTLREITRVPYHDEETVL